MNNNNEPAIADEAFRASVAEQYRAQQQREREQVVVPKKSYDESLWERMYPGPKD